MKKYLIAPATALAAVLILSLSACGGGGSDSPAVVTPPVASTDDAYTKFVDGKANQADTVDVEQVDTLVATAPETTEPAPVM